MVVIYTCIDGINIPVQPGPLTSVFFSGDCEDPAGFYEFWTMQNNEGSLTGVGLLAAIPVSGSDKRMLGCNPDSPARSPIFRAGG